MTSCARQTAEPLISQFFIQEKPLPGGNMTFSTTKRSGKSRKDRVLRGKTLRTLVFNQYRHVLVLHAFNLKFHLACFSVLFDVNDV